MVERSNPPVVSDLSCLPRVLSRGVLSKEGSAEGACPPQEGIRSDQLADGGEPEPSLKTALIIFQVVRATDLELDRL